MLERLKGALGRSSKGDDTQPAAILDQMREALGRIETRQLSGRRGPIQDHEFRVFSQNGEDGIIQFLVRHVVVERTVFVEIGVEDYREANTRFLLANNRWSGLIIDGDARNVDRIRADSLYWNSMVRPIAAFVTRENVNDLLREHGATGEIGLLSIDIDGNDYWVLDAIDSVSPAIAVVEYNHRFGPDRAVTIPYDATFVRSQRDWTWLFCGASLKAITLAAERKGLDLVGCNSFGNNAFFVRDDRRPAWLPKLSPEDAFVPGQFHEPLLVDGRLVEIDPQAEGEMLAQVPLVEVE